MAKALLPEDESFLRDFLDVRSGKYLLTIDTLLFLWRDEIPRDKHPTLGIPVPEKEHWLNTDAEARKARKDLRLKVTERWIGYWKRDRQQCESLQRLLKMLLEYDRPVPEPLQAWAFQMALEAEAPKSQGRPENLELNWRIYSAFHFLTQEKRFLNNAAHKIIAEITCKSPETIKSTVQKKKAFISENIKKG